jgi:HK97 gp10 family phage protein|tara:strand:- start:888 stop:1250 length:363 start_codon:yes stop_codon:yes gene_type:complete
MVKDIKELIPDIEKKFEQFKETLAHSLVIEAVKRVPVDTGNLKGSINAGYGDFIVNQDATDGVVKVPKNTVWVGAGFKEEVNYAKYVEFGTYKMAAQPFLRPAIHVTVERLDRIFKNVFK